MTTWAILASGPSMNKETADYVREKCKVAAVSNSFQLAPWADILVAHDRNWWRHYKEAMNFEGPKYCRFELNGTIKFSPPQLPVGCNSGLMAMYVALSLGATKLLLCGFDMSGSHFFGAHGGTLTNSTPNIFSVHLSQFKRFKGCEVVNCTPGSALKDFPFSTIYDML